MNNVKNSSELTQARSLAGGILQAALALPSLFHLSMAMGSPNFQYLDLIRAPSEKGGMLVMITFWGFPVLGLVIGHLIKRGFVWSYYVGLAIGFIALFALPPYSTIFGIALIYQLAKTLKIETATF